MKLNIFHETLYAYDEIISYGVQRLYLTPQDFASQKLVSWKITAPGIEGALSYLDGFGNRVHLVTARNIASPLRIVAEGVVEVHDAAGVVRGLRCAAADANFLRQTHFTQPDAAMFALADDVRAKSSGELDMVHRLLQAIHKNVVYQIGATNSDTLAAEAFAQGTGVCQDHSHIFLGLARYLNIPARYVTGYLATPEGETATASHAWAEALIPDLGWVGFDPANGMSPTDHYVRVAGGLDANDVTPVRGSRRGGAAEKMTVEVSVEIAQQ